jgi:hypothetical protein
LKREKHGYEELPDTCISWWYWWFIVDVRVSITRFLETHNRALSKSVWYNKNTLCVVDVTCAIDSKSLSNNIGLCMDELSPHKLELSIK